jgi:hypothetical protein
MASGLRFPEVFLGRGLRGSERIKNMIAKQSLSLSVFIRVDPRNPRPKDAFDSSKRTHE